jgi:N-acetylmuramoyl-L-alanine amidase
LNFSHKIVKVSMIAMKFPFTRNSETVVRREILRGVYEENLRILGKRRKKAVSKGGLSLEGKIFLILLVACLAVLVHGNSLTGPILPEGKLTASPIVPQALPRAQRGSALPSEYGAFIGSAGSSLSRVFGLGVKTIMIDPGHGGADSGTIGARGAREKDMTLDIARRLRARLLTYGRFKVLMTRDQDITVPLHRRVEMALSEKADLFISIHLNSLPSKPINIVETYYFGPSSDAKTLRLAEQENAGSQFGLSDFRAVIEKIGDTVKLQESRALASSIQKSLYRNIEKETGSAYDFGVKRAPFVVLLGVDVPAVLAEVSCLSNGEEEKKLGSEEHRENIARYLEAGILDYLTKGEAIYEANGRPEGR